jgi:hypothetical protein
VKYLTKYAPNMAYRVELTTRAGRDLSRIYRHVHADDSESAFAWLNGLEALVYSLDNPPTVPQSRLKAKNFAISCTAISPTSIALFTASMRAPRRCGYFTFATEHGRFSSAVKAIEEMKVQ